MLHFLVYPQIILIFTCRILIKIAYIHWGKLTAVLSTCFSEMRSEITNYWYSALVLFVLESSGVWVTFMNYFTSIRTEKSLLYRWQLAQRSTSYFYIELSNLYPYLMLVNDFLTIFKETEYKIELIWGWSTISRN